MWKRLWDELNVISPRAFYCTKMCEKSKSTTFSYYKIWLQIFYDHLANEKNWKIFEKYMRNEQGLGEKSYFEGFCRAQKIWLHTKFHIFLTFRFFNNKSFVSKQYLKEICIISTFNIFTSLVPCERARTQLSKYVRHMGGPDDLFLAKFNCS